MPARTRKGAKTANEKCVGEYVHKAGAAEASYLKLCNGQEISRVTYAALFAEIGTTFGAGNGSTTFNLPDFRGRVPGGAGSGTNLTARAVGASIGAEKHTLNVSEMPAHSHSIQGYTRTNYDANDTFSDYQGLDTGSSAYGTSSAGGGTAHNNMQPTIFAGYWFIYTGAMS